MRRLEHSKKSTSKPRAALPGNQSFHSQHAELIFNESPFWDGRHMEDNRYTVPGYPDRDHPLEETNALLDRLSAIAGEDQELFERLIVDTTALLLATVKHNLAWSKGYEDMARHIEKEFDYHWTICMLEDLSASKHSGH